MAEDLYRLHGERMDELCLVFPNRRAGLFFNKYLGESLEKPVWSPSIYTIQDLMARISELEYADDLELISSLYKVYSEVRGSGESFDEFFFWGETMLRDFDEVDKYLVDAGDLFRNITELKDIERSFQYLTAPQLELIKGFWSTFDPDSLSEQKQQFLEIWNILFPVYDKFREVLLGMGLGYEGMIYRNVAEITGKGEFSGLQFSRFVFIGFNALNPAEQKLFRSLEASGRALFYWDYDEYYLGSEMHEAGRYVRENLSVFRDSGESFRRDNLARVQEHVRVYSIPSDAGQAQLVYSILEDARKNWEPGVETAIVLADEELLIPVLNALPGELDEINVTMGYPVSATPVFSLIEHLISLQRNLREDKKGAARFYYRDLLPVLQHQYIILRQRADAGRIVREIHEQNIIYLPQAKLARNELFMQIFRKIEKPEDIAAYLITVLEMITGGTEEDDRPVPAMELEFIYRIYTRIKRLKDVLGRLEMNFTLPTFLRLFYKFLQRTRIPFSGEPLSGIQVMGVLETRVLDFDRVIILSMNEGSFPRTGSMQSFIPHNLRFGFKLPTLEHQDAIYAYYFYRLIQRARDVCLVYNNKADGLNSGEKSRYIYQLKYDPSFSMSEWSGGFDVQTSPVDPVRVNKTPAVMKRLLEFCPSEEGKGYLSSSALNTYIDCPLKFYLNYVAGIKEPDELQEEIDPAMFGTLIHESVRKIYESLDNPVQEKDLKGILKKEEKIRNAIDDSFREIWFRDAGKNPEGRNMVIREIIYTYVVQILEKDMEYCPLSIESLEESYYMEIPVRSGEADLSVRIGGKIDRIDEVDNSYRILDYKSGAGSMYFGSVGELLDPDQKNRNRAAFQTFLYAKLFMASGPGKSIPVCPGVYLIREIYKTGFRYHFSIGTAKKNIPVRDFSVMEEEFSSGLTFLLGRIFDPGEAFVQTGQEDICGNCPYRGICHR